MKNLIGIKANNGYFISELDGGYRSSLLDLFINGNKPEKTFHSDWVKVNAEPTKVQQLIGQPAINKRYELKDKSLSDKFKALWRKEDAEWWDESNDEYSYADGFIKELYEYKQDEQESILQDVEFVYTTIQEINIELADFGFTYSRAGQYSHQNYPNITEKQLKYDVIQQIITPSILHQFGPCQLTSKETYDIVRKHIQVNINHTYAKITSDYDFCLTVEKRIDMLKPHTYQVDVKNAWFKKSRKPKYETRVQTQRAIVVFKTAPAPYNGYTTIEPFKADSASEMKEVIDNYLSNLMAVINEPLKDCECCNGTGVKLINL